MASKTVKLEKYEPFPKGSHIISERDGYTHHGIYIGNEQVIHYSGWNTLGDFEGEIELVSLDAFRNGGGQIQIYATPDRSPYPPEEIISRAKSKIGEKDYNLFANNCEHFANWCFKDEKRSPQVTRTILLGALVLGRLLYTSLKK